MTFLQASLPELLASIQSCCSLCLSVSDMGVHALVKVSLLEVIFDGLFLFEFLFARQALILKVYSLLLEIKDLE